MHVLPVEVTFCERDKITLKLKKKKRENLLRLAFVMNFRTDYS